jgi:hypothetical protein
MEDMINFIVPHPIGVIPRKFWEEKAAAVPPSVRDEQRAAMLLEAVFRYRAAGFDPLPEWSAEWEEMLTKEAREAEIIAGLFEYDRRVRGHG